MVQSLSRKGVWLVARSVWNFVLRDKFFLLADTSTSSFPSIAWTSWGNSNCLGLLSQWSDCQGVGHMSLFWISSFQPVGYIEILAKLSPSLSLYSDSVEWIWATPVQQGCGEEDLSWWIWTVLWRAEDVANGQPLTLLARPWFPSLALKKCFGASFWSS